MRRYRSEVNVSAHLSNGFCTSPTSLVLDDRIDEFADIFREAYSIEDFGDPAAVTEVRMLD
jgi:hypothetical protein